MTNHSKPARKMKKEIPVFQYDDAWQILARGDRLNGLVIDADVKK